MDKDLSEDETDDNDEQDMDMEPSDNEEGQTIAVNIYLFNNT